MANDTQPLTVYFSLSLLQIMDVVSPAQRIPAGPGRGPCPLPRASASPPADPLCPGVPQPRNSGRPHPQPAVSTNGVPAVTFPPRACCQYVPGHFGDVPGHFGRF